MHISEWPSTNSFWVGAPSATHNRICRGRWNGRREAPKALPALSRERCKGRRAAAVPALCSGTESPPAGVQGWSPLQSMRRSWAMTLWPELHRTTHDSRRTSRLRQPQLEMRKPRASAHALYSHVCVRHRSHVPLPMRTYATTATYDWEGWNQAVHASCS
jgi:hypothetical protein